MYQSQYRPRRFRMDFPAALKELMNDMTREVLRCGPQNINLFLADYLDSLLITRNNCWVAEAILFDIHNISDIILHKLDKKDLTNEASKQVLNLLEPCLQKFVLGIVSAPHETRNEIISQLKKDLVDQLNSKIHLEISLPNIDIRKTLESAFGSIATVTMEHLSKNEFRRPCTCKMNTTNLQCQIIHGEDIYSAYSQNEKDFLLDVTEKIEKLN